MNRAKIEQRLFQHNRTSVDVDLFSINAAFRTFKINVPNYSLSLFASKGGPAPSGYLRSSRHHAASFSNLQVHR